MLLFKGENGQGKSNLLEAIYLLAIAKSARASADDSEPVREPSSSIAKSVFVVFFLRK